MKIGVIFHGNPIAGGCYQQSLNATRLLSKDKESNSYIYYTPDANNANNARKDGIVVKNFRFGRKQRLIHKLRKFSLLHRFFGKFAFFEAFDIAFEKDDVDLLYFTGPSPICLFLERLNYVYTVWDLCHRDHPEFPEVRHNFEFEAREDLMHISLSRAVSVIAESPLGRKNLIKRYGLDKERVHWISISPAKRQIGTQGSDFDPRDEAGIPPNAPYVFYPAQFWAHKNHRLIVDSLAILSSSEEKVYAIFCGSDCGNLQQVMKMARVQGVLSLIKYVGFVPDEKMPSYYMNSLALVMPSYFGPSNMPPLEAFELETPVIVSDLPGIRDQVGEAALLVAPDKAESLANAIQRLLNEPDLRNYLVKKGIDRLSQFSDEDRISTLRQIFNNFKLKRLTWSIDD